MSAGDDAWSKAIERLRMVDNFGCDWSNMFRDADTDPQMMADVVLVVREAIADVVGSGNKVNESMSIRVPCDECEGEGSVDGSCDPCPECDGEGCIDLDEERPAVPSTESEEMMAVHLPVDVARNIGETHDKDIVLIVGWDMKSGVTNIVTWGREPVQKEAAARAGDRIQELLGLAESVGTMHQDFRREGEAARAVDTLVLACRAADYAIGSVMAMRDGITDELLQHVRDSLQAAMRQV